MWQTRTTRRLSRGETELRGEYRVWLGVHLIPGTLTLLVGVVVAATRRGGDGLLLLPTLKNIVQRLQQDTYVAYA